MEKSMTRETARSVFRAVPTLVGIPARKYWVDYDEEADVLYVSFDRPQKATDTEMTDDGLLLRYRGDSLVGVTVLNASTRSQETQGAA
jgi:uncharacterized protein YuzE